MSLVSQQFTEGKAGLAIYVSGEVVAAGAAKSLMFSFNTSTVKFAGLSIGIGLSEPAAWGAGMEFEIIVNGSRKILIDDEICTLLQKEFLPMDLPANADVEMFAQNFGANDVIVAAFARAEVY